MDRWEGKVAIVSGASAGIGAKIVDQLLDHGLKVVGLARRKEKLEALDKKLKDKKGKFYYFVADISIEEDVVKAFRWVKENIGVVNVLINNAGVYRLSSLIEGNSEHMREVFDTNVFGLCIITREALKEMQSNEIDGHIVHINSVGGHKVVKSKFTNVYPASKYAVTALTETLSNELSLIDSKIKVSSISPGCVQTEMIEAAMKNSRYGVEVLEFFKGAPMLQPKDVADAVIFVLSTPPHVQIRELIIKPVGEPF